jgi:hypothetical protein
MYNMVLSQKAKFKLGDLRRMSGTNYRASNFRFSHQFATCLNCRLEEKVKGYRLWAKAFAW